MRMRALERLVQDSVLRGQNPLSAALSSHNHEEPLDALPAVATPSVLSAAAPAPPAIFPAVALRPRTRLPDPPTFSGDRNEWPSWKVAMENKLLVDQEALGDEVTQFLYVYSRLAGSAARNVTSFVSRHRLEPGGLSRFLAHLGTLYGDPNVANRAANQLHTIRQGERQSFAKFVPLLEKVFADAGAYDWPDEAKRPILLNALNQQMRTALANRGIPQRFEDIVSTLHTISVDLDLLNVLPGQRSGAALPGPLPPTSRGQSRDMMEWEPTPPSSTRIARVNPSGHLSTRPEDRKLLGKRAKWVDEEVVAARRADGLCLRCGRSGCRVRLCPLAPARRPTTTSITPVVAPRPATTPRAAVKRAAPKREAARIEELSGSEWESDSSEEGSGKV